MSEKSEETRSNTEHENLFRPVGEAVEDVQEEADNDGEVAEVKLTGADVDSVLQRCCDNVF